VDALEELFSHNCWANERLLEHCAQLPLETLQASVPGTFGTIIDTLRHLSGAEERYLALLEGRPFRAEAMERANLDLSALRREAAHRAERWGRLLAAKPDLQRVVTRTRPDGTEDAATTRTVLVQAIHHGNDHRTHVCTILGSLDGEPPILDAWTFYGER
jgi:uncharacterized damage-inducible protein DinB